MQFVPSGNRKTPVYISSFWYKHFLMSNNSKSCRVRTLEEQLSRQQCLVIGTDLLSRQFGPLSCKEKFYI